jgi:hypothetical protein
MVSRALLFGMAVCAVAAAQEPAVPRPALIISGDTVSGACSAGRAAVVIQRWFTAMNDGDTSQLRRLALPAFKVFSAGVKGRREPTFRGDSASALVGFVARRHRAGDRLTLLEIAFNGHRDDALGFMPIFRRESRDPKAITGTWLGKGEFRCHRGVAVLNLAPWPANVPPYTPGGTGRRLRD